MDGAIQAVFFQSSIYPCNWLQCHFYAQRNYILHCHWGIELSNNKGSAELILFNVICLVPKRLRPFIYFTFPSLSTPFIAQAKANEQLLVT